MLRGLVLHQGDQRADHHGRSAAGHRGKLVAQRFSAARGHHHRDVAPAQDGLDDGFLARAEFRIAPMFLKERPQVGHWTPSSLGAALPRRTVRRSNSTLPNPAVRICAAQALGARELPDRFRQVRIRVARAGDHPAHPRQHARRKESVQSPRTHDWSAAKIPESPACRRVSARAPVPPARADSWSDCGSRTRP